MEQLLKINIPGYYKYIQIIKNSTEKVMEFFEIKEEERYSIKLAISEAVANIIKHSYKGEGDNIIEYCILINAKNEFEFVLIDYGLKVEKEIIKSRNLEELDERGLGVHLMNSIMDNVEYKHIDRGTKLIMKKKIGDDSNA